MRTTIDREKVLLILEWCINKFGKSKFHNKLPVLRVYKTEGKSGYSDRLTGLCGTYCDGTITIYLASNRSVRELCCTVIHEYKHYLMSEKEFRILHKKMTERGCEYDDILRNHPHEKRAVRAENTWGDICFNELKSKLYKKD